MEYIFQVGPSRTATTLQFQILCALTRIKFPNKSIECVHGRGSLFFRKDGSKSSEYNHTKDNKKRRDIVVLKSHDIMFSNHLRGFVNKINSYFFMTSGRNSRAEKKLKNTIKPILIVDRTLVEKKGSDILDEYIPFFGLSEKQADPVKKYLDVWTTMRYL